MAYAWAAGAGVMLASILGSGRGLIWRNISHRANDMILGYAAGVMLTAAFEALLPTGFAQTDLIGIFTGCAGVVAGAWFISLMDRFVPHMHFENGTFDNSEAHGKTNRVPLLVNCHCHPQHSGGAGHRAGVFRRDVAKCAAGGAVYGDLKDPGGADCDDAAVETGHEAGAGVRR